MSMKGVLSESWVFDAKEPISCAPLIVDGHLEGRARIVLATKLGKVFVLDRLGNIDWIFDSAKTFSEEESLFLDVEEINTITNTPIIVHDKKLNVRKIIFGSENGNLYCIGNQGELIWNVLTNGPIRGSPISVRNKDDGITIIFGSHDGNLYMIDINGQIIKQIEIGKG